MSSCHFVAQGAAVKRVLDRFAEVSSSEFRGDFTLHVPAALLLDVMRFCRDVCGFDMLLCVSAVDHLDEECRFEVVYQLSQAEVGADLLVSVRVPEECPCVPSVVSIWRSANWLEREQYDMLGVIFEGHPDLRRILMWDGYPYYPMRKDFPLEGVPTELPGVAFTQKAPTMGAPFCTRPGQTAGDREPASRPQV